MAYEYKIEKAISFNIKLDSQATIKDRISTEPVRHAGQQHLEPVFNHERLTIKSQVFEGGN